MGRSPYPDSRGLILELQCLRRMKTGLQPPEASLFPGGSHRLSEAVRFISVPYHLPPLQLERSDAIGALFLNAWYTISTNWCLLKRLLLQTRISLLGGQ